MELSGFTLAPEMEKSQPRIDGQHQQGVVGPGSRSFGSGCLLITQRKPCEEDTTEKCEVKRLCF